MTGMARGRVGRGNGLVENFQRYALMGKKETIGGASNELAVLAAASVKSRNGPEAIDQKGEGEH